MAEKVTRRRIEFADTDLAGMVHFSRFFVFMESAEDQFLRSLGASFTTGPDGRRMGWPKVSATCDYREPLHYGDEVEIRLRVAGRSRRTVTYEFTFLREDRVMARGRTTSVCCVREAGGRLRASTIPEALEPALRPDAG